MNSDSSHPRPWTPGVFLISAILVGCSGDSTANKAPSTFPVSGAVTLDGKALPEGDIQFTNPASGHIETGKITDGKYQAKAAAGKNRVEISAFREGEGTMPGVKQMIQYLPERYNANTTLEAEVKESGPNTFDYKLDSKS
jgi:hypothetical protein